MKRQRPSSRYAAEAAQLLGTRIASARRERRISATELAERVGVTRKTLRKVEAGDLTVGLGVAFEAAAIVGVPLFEAEPSRLTADLDRARSQLALLPDRVRRSAEVNDDF